MVGSDFVVIFSYNERATGGARARRRPRRAARRFRRRFAYGGTQVPDAQTFCALVEQELRQRRDVRCANFGVSGTGPFDYYHRVRHDVLKTRPTAIVLCLYPGNDYRPLPPRGLRGGRRAAPEYFRPYTPRNRVVTWAISHSKVCHYLYWIAVTAAVALKARAGSRRAGGGRRCPPCRKRSPIPAFSAPWRRSGRRWPSAVRRACRSGCSSWGRTGDLPRAVDGKSPVAGLLEQAGIDVPVLDVAVDMAADRQRLRFPRDVHPNREGHAVIAARATPSLLACSGSATAPIPRAPGAPPEQPGRSRWSEAWRKRRKARPLADGDGSPAAKALYLLIVYSVFFMLYEGGLRLFAVRESWDRSLGWTPCGAARSRGTRAGPGLAA